MHINVKHKCFHCLMLTVLCFVWLCFVVLNGFRLSDDVNAQQETEPVFYHTPASISLMTRSSRAVRLRSWTSRLGLATSSGLRC